MLTIIDVLFITKVTILLVPLFIHAYSQNSLGIRTNWMKCTKFPVRQENGIHGNSYHFFTFQTLVLKNISLTLSLLFLPSGTS